MEIKHQILTNLTEYFSTSSWIKMQIIRESSTLQLEIYKQWNLINVSRSNRNKRNINTVISNYWRYSKLPKLIFHYGNLSHKLTQSKIGRFSYWEILSDARKEISTLKAQDSYQWVIEKVSLSKQYAKRRSNEFSGLIRIKDERLPKFNTVFITMSKVIPHT